MKCINGWTKQSMIDHIKKEFRGKSVDEHRCVYRGPEGTKCAVGMFIPDELYRAEMEGNAYYSETASHKGSSLNLVSHLMPLPADCMYELQKVHDCSSPESCLTRMIKWIERTVQEDL